MIYVASSWRNTFQPTVIKALRAANLECYDFRNPADGLTGFEWREVEPSWGLNVEAGVTAESYLRGLAHPISRLGYDRDFTAMEKADTFVLVLPCGRSAHLELGWAVGAGKRTAILLDDPCTPELMYLMCDYLALSLADLLDWLGVSDCRT